MKLSKTWKVVIGILTVLQLFVGLFYLVWFMTVLLPELVAGNEAAIESMLMASLGGFIVSAIVLSFISSAVLVFYIVHTASNQHLGAGMKVVWILLFFFFLTLAQVAYFFMEIIPEKSITARIQADQGAS